tara:strand:- start:9816 stop:10454 length:639 start_codon:yes stop_codon:yes gene_type:complete
LYDLTLTDSKFDSNPYWDVALRTKLPPIYVVPDLFDQNGYDLSMVEQSYANINNIDVVRHKLHRSAIRSTWFKQNYKAEGSVLNHALMFERKGYAGQALDQLRAYAKVYPIYYKLVNIKPKWGLDFSMDYFDSEGNTIEVLHWEYDGFDHDDVNSTKIKMDSVLVGIDWDDAAKHLLRKKDEWYSLDFFSQSAYKCSYFGIPQEHYKMVVWE